MWIPDSLYDAAKCSSSISFWCAYGHQQHFVEGETDETKLRRERDNLKQQNARLADEAQQALIRANKAEGVTRRLKKRVAQGVCPCCHRTVAQMAAHMKTKHPDYVSDNVVNLKVKA